MHPGHHRFSHPLERLTINEMASRSSFYLVALALLLSLAPPTEANSEVYIYKIESGSSLNGHKITLQCSFGSGTSGDRVFYRQVGDTIESITNSTENAQRITFELEPRLDGYYFCQAGNVTSNKLLVLGKSVKTLKCVWKTYFLDFHFPLHSNVWGWVESLYQ